MRNGLAMLVMLGCLAAIGTAAYADPAQDPNYVPVAKRPRSEVLAKGDGRYLRPDLTRGQLNDYRELIAWILNIKFSDAQQDEYEQRMITRWPSLYGMDTDEITGASKRNAEIRAMPPAQLKATHKELNEQVLKNLRDMVAGAGMIGSFKVVTSEDRKDAAWLLAVYEDQHPEAVAPMPAMPDVPGTTPPQQPRSSVDQPRTTTPTADATLAAGATPLKQSSTDAMSQIICFLSAKSQNIEYLPPSDDFRAMFARKVAAEYPKYTTDQQAAFAKLPAYWTQLKSSWDRMSAFDQNTTLATWKPMLDALHNAVPAQSLSAEDQTALTSMTDQQAQTQQRLEQLRALKQRDINQQLQLAQMERMQQMQAEQIRMMSNIAASAHETNMTIIHNMGPTRHPWDP
ncbi:MAG TPA: hypothetical protein VH518_12995 [Tepidisphaeraceae bacterium]|jgi:hypothetical protein